MSTLVSFAPASSVISPVLPVLASTSESTASLLPWLALVKPPNALGLMTCT